MRQNERERGGGDTENNKRQKEKRQTDRETERDRQREGQTEKKVTERGWMRLLFTCVLWR